MQASEEYSRAAACIRKDMNTRKERGRARGTHRLERASGATSEGMESK
jgi:hypothetical protein